MNIGIVTTWFERGAAYVSLQYANLLKDGHNIFIYARGGYDENYHPEFNITVDKNHNLIVKAALNTDQYENWIKENNITHVLFNEQFWWKPIVIAKKLNVVCFAYIDYYTADTVDLFQIYDKVICNTKRHFSVFEKFNNAVYLPWGTEIDVFKFDKKENKELTFFHSTGWSPFRKGTDFLIDAFYEIKLPCRLIIHSQGDLKKLMPKSLSKINELLNKGKLEIILDTVEAPGLYHLGDVYVYPTRLEGIGLTIAEALSCGLPTIVPDNGPMNEFICPETCKVVKVETFKMRDDNYYWPMCEVSISDLKKQMEYYIENQSIIKEISIETRKYAEKQLDWKKNAIQLEAIFQETKSVKIDNVVIESSNRSDINIMKFGGLYTFSPSFYKFLVSVYKRIKS
jgi:glycosyltransferase involved in cell wall biosynthesis